MGHFIGVFAFVVVSLLGAADAPSVFVTHQVVLIRIACSALAVGVAVALEILMQASHPPAAATVLLITLGGLAPSFHNAVIIISGVVLLRFLAEPLRRLSIRQLTTNV